jgi:lipoate-protein ligase B
MHVQDLGTMPYRQAWAVQQQMHAEVVAGGPERLLLVEHPPVITFGRRAQTWGRKNLVAPEQHLQQLGVELVESDRGGDVTFHGPGQIVAYPIVRLNDHMLSVGGYVRRLEQVVIATLAELGVAASTDPDAVGVWVREPDGQLAKICAIGVRIRRGVCMHGIALNVETDLRYFELIIPCGLAGRRVTSLRRLLGDATPELGLVKQTLAGQFQKAFGSAHDHRGV